MELDALDRLAAEAFPGSVVRKDLALKFKGQYPVPTYVGEFLLGRYCASTDEAEIAEGLEIVRKQLQDRTIRAGEQELFKSRAREKGTVKLIDLVTARLDAGTRQLPRHAAERPAQGRADRRRSGPRQRADADRRVLRRDRARVRRGDHRGGEGPAVRDRRACGRSSSRGGTSSTSWPAAGRAFTSRQWRDLLLRSVGFEPVGADRARAGRAPAPDGPVRRAQLQPGRARPARHRQVAPLPAGVAVRPPRVRRQGHRRQDVRGQLHGPAGPGRPVRRRLLRRGQRHRLRPEGRRQHPQGLHGVRGVQPRQGVHPGFGRRRHGRQLRGRRGPPAAGQPPLRAVPQADEGRHRLHGPDPRLRAGLGRPEAQPRRCSPSTSASCRDFVSETLEPAARAVAAGGAPGTRLLRRRAERARHDGGQQDHQRPAQAPVPRPRDARSPTRTSSGPSVSRSSVGGASRSSRSASGRWSSGTPTSATRWARTASSSSSRRPSFRAPTRSGTTRSRPARSGRSARAGKARTQGCSGSR